MRDVDLGDPVHSAIPDRVRLLARKAASHMDPAMLRMVWEAVRITIARKRKYAREALQALKSIPPGGLAPAMLTEFRKELRAPRRTGGAPRPNAGK